MQKILSSFLDGYEIRIHESTQRTKDNQFRINYVSQGVDHSGKRKQKHITASPRILTAGARIHFLTRDVAACLKRSDNSIISVQSLLPFGFDVGQENMRDRPSCSLALVYFTCS